MFDLLRGLDRWMWWVVNLNLEINREEYLRKVKIRVVEKVIIGRQAFCISFESKMISILTRWQTKRIICFGIKFDGSFRAIFDRSVIN